MTELSGIQMPDAGFRLEKDFTTYWLRKLVEKGFWKKKWSDASMDKKPYDCDIRTNVASYHCEIKIVKDDEFSFDKFEPNQIKALDHISRLGGNAIVVIYSIAKNAYCVWRFEDLKRACNYSDV